MVIGLGSTEVPRGEGFLQNITPIGWIRLKGLNRVLMFTQLLFARRRI